MSKKITAEFSGMDAAESAARQAKHRFNEITDTKIFYKNSDKDGLDKRRHILTSPEKFTNSALGGIYFPSYVSNYRDNIPDINNGVNNGVYHSSYNGIYDSEIEQRDEVLLQIFVDDDNTAKNVSNYLRSAGGLGVKTTEV